jgi:hypothetical protein
MTWFGRCWWLWLPEGADMVGRSAVHGGWGAGQLCGICVCTSHPGHTSWSTQHNHQVRWHRSGGLVCMLSGIEARAAVVDRMHSTVLSSCCACDVRAVGQTAIANMVVKLTYTYQSVSLAYPQQSVSHSI